MAGSGFRLTFGSAALCRSSRTWWGNFYTKRYHSHLATDCSEIWLNSVRSRKPNPKQRGTFLVAASVADATTASLAAGHTRSSHRVPVKIQHDLAERQPTLGSQRARIRGTIRALRGSAALTGAVEVVVAAHGDHLPPG